MRIRVLLFQRKQPSFAQLFAASMHPPRSTRWMCDRQALAVSPWQAPNPRRRQLSAATGRAKPRRVRMPGSCFIAAKTVSRSPGPAPATYGCSKRGPAQSRSPDGVRFVVQLLPAAAAACSSSGMALPISATPKIMSGALVCGSAPQ